MPTVTVILSLVLILIIGLAPIVAFFLPMFARRLGERVVDESGKELRRETIFAIVQEGRGRAIERNEKFFRGIMSYASHEFAGNIPIETLQDLVKKNSKSDLPDLLGPLDEKLEQTDPRFWEIIQYPKPPKEYNLLQKLFSVPAWDGIYWMGRPGVYQIPRYRFTWVEWAQKVSDSGSATAEKTAIPRNEQISWVLIQPDVYFVRVKSAETREGTPVDIDILLTINTNNLYRVLYGAENWLEAVTNQAEAIVRGFVGNEKLLNLLTVDVGEKEAVKGFIVKNKSKKRLEKALEEDLKRYREEYGVTVSKSQIHSVEPAGEDAEKIRTAVIVEFEANAAAKKKRIEADAKAYEIKKIAEAEKEAVKEVLGAAASIPGGINLFRWLQTGKLGNLTTLVVEDGKDGPRIVIPTDRS